MVKTVLSVAHQGLRDWMVQRVTAIVMAVYSVGLMAYIVLDPEVTYAEWHALFALTWVKVATLLFVSSVCWHAWLGIWSIYTDYVKNFVVRAFLEVCTVLMLAACVLWAIMILWSV